jgi:hypothetical protein
MEIGFHTDVFNNSYWSFDRCLVWAHQNQLKCNRMRPRPKGARGGIDAPVKPGLDGGCPLFFTPGVSKLP